METLLQIGLSNAVGSAVLAVLAAGLSRIVRRPALTHVLWVIVLLKLVTPPLIVVPVRGWTLPRQIALEQHPQALELTARVPSGSAAPLPVVQRSRISYVAPFFPATIALVWLSGTALLAAVAGLRLRRFSKLLRFASSAPDDVRKQCRELAARLGLRRCPPVDLLAGNVCPMLWAPLFRPRLILPAELLDRLSTPRRSSLLLHELAHLKRNDHLVRLLELLALPLFWWNPVAWWARHQLRQAEEQCCDAWVTWAMPAGNHDYAAALVEAVEFASTTRDLPSPSLPALASGIGEFRHLKRRLIMIQQGTGNRTLGKLGIACACAAAILLPLTVSRAQQRPAPAASARSSGPASRPTTQPQVDPALLARLDRKMPEVKFDAVGLSDVFDFMQDVSGIRIVVDWQALEHAGIRRDTPVSLDLRNVTVSKAMTAILDSVAKPGVMTWRPSGNLLLVTTAQQPHQRAAAKPENPQDVVIRVYDARDLIANNNADTLIRLITGSIAPDSWKADGGEKSGSIRLVNGQLVIRQSVANQRAIFNLIVRTRQLMKDHH